MTSVFFSGATALRRRIGLKRQLAARLCRHSALIRRYLLPAMVKARYRTLIGSELNLHSPTLFSEKIQWLKIFGHQENLAPFVDKLGVRDFVSELVSPDILVPLHSVHQSGSQVPWSDLGPEHVVKTNHGSGFFLMMADHSETTPEALAKIVDDWLQTHYFDNHYEPQYIPIQPCILVEQRIGGPGRTVDVHRIYCQNGEPELIMVDIFDGDMRYNATFDATGRRIPGRIVDPDFPGDLHSPAGLDALVKTARSLSAPFPFVRVDLYHFNDLIYFSEYTFSPNAGIVIAEPLSLELHMAALIDLAACSKAAQSLSSSGLFGCASTWPKPS